MHVAMGVTMQENHSTFNISSDLVRLDLDLIILCLSEC